MPNGTKFSRKILRLGRKVHALEESLLEIDNKTIEKEINACNAFAEELEKHALRYNVDLSNYYIQFMDIQNCLTRIKIRFEKSKRPWWKKALYGIAHVINIVTTLLGWGLYC